MLSGALDSAVFTAIQTALNTANNSASSGNSGVSGTSSTASSTTTGTVYDQDHESFVDIFIDDDNQIETVILTTIVDWNDFLCNILLLNQVEIDGLIEEKLKYPNDFEDIDDDVLSSVKSLFNLKSAIT